MNIQKTLGAGIMSLGLVLGASSFAGATSGGGGSIDYTGPHSRNVIRSRRTQRVNIRNDNDIDVRNNNYQNARTGNAIVRDNTKGGEARSGDATNRNSTRANIRVDNTGSGAAALVPFTTDCGCDSGSISDTGPHSHNRISSTTNSSVRVDNDNDIDVRNTNVQNARTGNAIVSDNTKGGDATSGDARNTNSTSLTVRVNN